MSEFKLSCPHCQQHVLADDAWAGNAIDCPHCRKAFTIPAPPGATLPPPAAARSQPSTQPPGPASTSKRTSGLAIASLVLALLGCFGITALAAVICGHLARRKMRADESLGGRGLALAGLIIGYIMLLGFIVYVTLVSLAVVSGVRDFQSAFQKHAQTGNVVTGTIAGSPFTCSSAMVDSFMGTIEIIEGDDAEAGQGVKIFLFPKSGETLAGRTWNISSASDGSQPHVHLSWKKDGQAASAILSSDYEMHLTTSAVTNGVVMGTITFKSGGETPASFQGEFIAPVK